MSSAVLKFSVILLVVACCSADVSHVVNGGQQPVTDVCLGCLCQAVSGCKLPSTCEGDHCGLFHITWPYWADAGKPVLPGESPEQPDAFRHCALDPHCAAATVQGYMSRYGQDCNGDGHVDCYDYLAIHKLGGYGCNGDLPYKYVNVYQQCLARASQQG